MGEKSSMMREVKVDLDFACCYCGACLGVTLKCVGQGLSLGLHAVAAALVPCPTCGTVNQLFFEPCGTLRAVAPVPGPQWRPEPSIN
jgi:hypothetical protein